MEIKTFIRVRARPPFLLHLLISEQNQRRVYHEVLIAGDLSKEDVYRAVDEGWFFSPGRTTSDTAELPYDNDTVYLAQPSLSQFVPGGSGAGSFNLTTLIAPKVTPNNTLLLTGRDAHNGYTNVVLRYASGC